MLRPTTSPKKHVMSEEEIQIEYNAKRRQNQIDIFYLTGRKIHNVTMDTAHMRKFRNDVRHDDKPPWNRILRCHDDSDRGGQRWKIDAGIPNNPGGQYPMPTKSTKSDKRDIIEGYQGIMPLNMTDILPQFRKQALDRHMNDIKEYKREQLERPKQLRYENTVVRAENIRRLESIAAKKRVATALEAQAVIDNQASSGRRQYAERESNIRQVMAGTVSDTDDQTTGRTSDK
jgi:hypothetical protein